MGIQNLLIFLENSTRNCHISEFRGKTLAIDSYCWLHKGCRSCSEQLANGIDTDLYIQYCLKYIKMLRDHDIKPIMVFDGRRLPAKSQTEQKRKDNKKKALRQANEYMRLGKIEEARKLYKQTVDVTPQMALKLMQNCRKINIDCIVAPYESDAQLAFFSLQQIVDGVITEDSDLLPFGCEKVVFKLDLSGHCKLVESDKIYKSMNMKPEQYTFEKFRFMCILSGCDYANSLHGIGLKKSLKFLAMTAETNPTKFLDKLPRYLNMRHLTVDDDYKDQFLTADATFRHQLVYDPLKRKLRPLTELDYYKDKPQYCRNAGEMLSDDVAYELALGNLDPNTLEKICSWRPPNDTKSIWCPYYRKPTSQKSITISPKIHRPLTFHKDHNVDVDSDDYDIKLQKELEYYKSLAKPKNVMDKSLTDKPSEISPTKIVDFVSKNPFSKTAKQILSEEKSPKESSDVEQESPETSPVIGQSTRNPFAKKLILSTMCKRSLVKSRFFNHQPEEILSSDDNNSQCNKLTNSQTSEKLTTVAISSDGSEGLIDDDNNKIVSQINSIETLKIEEYEQDDEVVVSQTSEGFEDGVLTSSQGSASNSLYKHSQDDNLMSKQINVKKRKSETQLFSKHKKSTKKQLSLKDMFSKMQDQ